MCILGYLVVWMVERMEKRVCKVITKTQLQGKIIIHAKTILKNKNKIRGLYSKTSKLTTKQ